MNRDEKIKFLIKQERLIHDQRVSLEREVREEIQASCSHTRSFIAGHGRHGSDKGDEYRECPSCKLFWNADR